ncbi:MAG: hypothetical protein ACTSU5_22440 [Promethearchaeota archaeon]
MFGNDFDLSGLKDMIEDAIEVDADEDDLTILVKINAPEGLSPGMDSFGPNFSDPSQVKTLLSQFGDGMADGVEIEGVGGSNNLKIKCASREKFDEIRGVFENFGDFFEKVIEQLMGSLMDIFGSLAGGDGEGDDD